MSSVLRSRWFIAFIGVVGGALFFGTLRPVLAVHWVFGLAFGWVLLRAGFCFVAAVRDPVLTGGTGMTRGLLAAIAAATAGFAVVTLITGQTGTVAPVGLNTVVGGILFGAAMVVAGGCVSGTLMRMGDGFVMQWTAFAGLIGGSLLGARACCTWNSALTAGARRIFLPDLLGWGPTLLLQTAGLGLLWWLAVRRERSAFGRPSNASGDGATTPEDVEKPEDSAGSRRNLRRLLGPGVWTPVRGGLVLGLLNVAYFAFSGRAWGITTELTYWASGLWRLLGQHPERWVFFSERGDLPTGATLLFLPGTALNLGIVVGAFLASFVAGQWRFRRMPGWRHFLAALAGGLVMGYASRLAHGCNIGALFSGTASLSLHGWVYFGATCAGAVAGLRIAQAFLFRPVLKRLAASSSPPPPSERVTLFQKQGGGVSCRR